MTNGTVAAIISAYNPPDQLLKTATDLIGVVDFVIVVDDGSSHDSDSVLEELHAQGVNVIRHGANRGIAAALNTGISEAERECKPRFYVTLDQDSIISDDYVSKALDTFRRAELADVSIGFVCAATYNNIPILLDEPEANFSRPFDPWQSGLVIPAETFDRVGRFAEHFFIDAVDSEFTLRVRKAGMHPIVGEGCNVSHEIGEPRIPRFLGRRVSFGGRLKTYSAHEPIRVYYMVRNGVILWRSYLAQYPAWLRRKAYYDAKGHFVRLFFGRHPLRILVAMVGGAIDGIIGRAGRIGGFTKKLLS